MAVMSEQELAFNRMFKFYMANSFLNGADRFVTLPTSLYYVLYLGYSKAFLGIVLAMSALGFTISAPILGKLADKVVSGDIIFFVSLIGHSVGNLIYAIPFTGYFPLAGRLVTGISGSALGSVYGETARKTPPNELAKRLIILSAMYNFGMITGPFIGSLLQFTVRLGKFEINPGNSPALVMLVVWGLLALAWWACFGGQARSNSGPSCSYEKIALVEEAGSGKKGRRSKHNWPGLLCLMYTVFTMACLNATAQICVPLVATKLFHLRLLTLKMVFANGIAFILLAYAISYFAKTYYDDRFLFTFVFAAQVISPLALGAVSVFWYYLPVYGAYLLVPFLCFGMSSQVAVSFCQSLITRVTDSGDMSFYQSLSGTIFHIGVIATDGIVGLIIKDAPFSLIILSNSLISLWIIGIVWLVLILEKHLALHHET